MSKSANKTLIGAFVVGAAALLLIAIAVFGSGKLFSSTFHCVMFFDSSVSGLSVGSPVMFRGVPVGRVTEIRLSGDMKRMLFRTPVFVELDQARSNPAFNPEDQDMSSLEYLSKLIEHGLRARLTTQSLLTGQLMIEIDFFSRQELTQKITEVQLYDHLPEIPTIPSKLDNIWQKFNALPIEQVSQNILDITDSLKHLVQETDTAAIVNSLNQLVGQFQTITQSVDKTLASIQGLSGSYAQLAVNTDKRISSTLSEAAKTLSTINGTVHKAEQVITSTQGIVGKNSVTMLQFNQTLREISDAARAIRVLANTLERTPEVLLRGKTRYQHIP